MNRSTYRFTLDLQKHRSQMSIAVFVHDSAVRLYISLTDGGNPYRIESGGRAVFYGTRPDDTPLCHNCMIDDTGRIIYDFNDQTASVVGITHCQIRIYGKDGELITAPRFSIVADERLVYDADIEKLSDSPLAALDEIQFAEIDRVGAETARAEAEKARAEAEAERIEAETERIKNENERIEAEKKRQYYPELKADKTEVNKLNTRITEIENHLAPKYIITDDTTAYKKDVPANACSNAQLNSIGGMTYKSDNLIPFPYKAGEYGEGFTVEMNSGKFVVNAEGGITLSGTPTGHSAITLFSLNDLSNINVITASLQGDFTNVIMTMTVTFDDDTTNVVELNNSGTVIKKSDYPNATKYRFELKRKNNNSAMSGICYPMLNPGETVLPWTPFFEGFRHSAVTKLKLRGRNVLGGTALSSEILSNVEGSNSYEEGKRISFPCTNAKGFKYTDFKPNTEYTFIFYGYNSKTTERYSNLTLRYTDGKTITTVLGNSSFLFETAGTPSYAIAYSDPSKSVSYIAGSYETGTTYLYPDKCGIFEGHITLEQFQAYEEKTIFKIPPEVQALPNYGKMFTELDLVNKKFIDEYAEMDGVVSWDENPVQTFEIWGGDDGVTVLGYNCSVQFMRGDLMDDGNIGLVITEKPYDSIEYTDRQFILHKYVAQLNSFGSNDNYEIAEELFGKVTIVAKNHTVTEYDISEYIDNNIIKVKECGSIEFVNDKKHPVPSSVSYMMGGHLLEKEV